MNQNSQNQKIKLMSIRVPMKLYNQLDERKFEEGFSTLNQFCVNLFKDYLRSGSFSKKILSKDFSEYEDLLKQQQEFIRNLDNVLKLKAEDPKPEDFENNATRILALLKSSPMKFKEIVKITGIKESDVLGIIGHLYDGGKIAYNDKWEYFTI